MKHLIISLSWMGVFAAAMTPAFAGAPDDDPNAVLSNQQIQQALQAPVTRSFTPRGLARRQAAESGQSVNLNIPFEHNSSALMPQASAQLRGDLCQSRGGHGAFSVQPLLTSS